MTVGSTAKCQENKGFRVEPGRGGGREETLAE